MWLLSHVLETSIPQLRVTGLVTHQPELSLPLVDRTKIEELHIGIMEYLNVSEVMETTH